MHTLVVRTIQGFPVLKPPPHSLIKRLSRIMTMPTYRTLWTPHRYPSTRRSDHVDVYKSESRGEVHVRDPFQWLEHSTQETEDWTCQQDAFTRGYLDQNPDRQKLEDEIRANSDFAKVYVSALIVLYILEIVYVVFGTNPQGRQSLVLVLQQWFTSSIGCVKCYCRYQRP